MCVSAPKSYRNHNLSRLEPQIIKKKNFNLHFDSHFVFFAHMKVNVAASLNFFHLNLLVDNVFFQYLVFKGQI